MYGAAGLAMVLATSPVAAAQSDQHGRKWKPLPPTAHIVVTVVKAFNDKPLPNAAVVFHAVRDGRDDGNLEVKTDPDGKATIDVIEMGSQLTIQVIADGFATSAQDMTVDQPNEALEVKLLRPRAQVSIYSDNDGKAAQVKPGIQEHYSENGASSPPSRPAATSPVSTNPTQIPGPLNAPPGTVTVPTQPGAPAPVAPPVAPPPTGTPLPSGTPQ